ncbi:MAG: esterase [Ardenticatenaceae bacterium]|nr:esterase [Ardenticatenaceae bacterium]
MRINRFVSLLLFSVLLMGCRSKTYLTKTIEIDGIARTYHIHLPPDFSEDNPAPLVLALHGGGGNGLRFDRGVTNNTLIPAADERGIVLVFPEGIDHQWCDGRFAQIDPASPCQDRNDVPFLSAIIDTMIQDYGVDPARVYATGISNGGFMSFRLAIDLSDKIAAIAPVTAQLSAALENQSPQNPISVMLINGTADPLVPYDGGEVRVFDFGRSRGEVQSTDETIAHFRSHNGCELTPAIAQPVDDDPDDDKAVTIKTYTHCQANTDVILVKVEGGGHTWPGGKQYLSQDRIGTVSQEINASELILEFFLNHPREELSEN